MISLLERLVSYCFPVAHAVLKDRAGMHQDMDLFQRMLPPEDISSYGHLIDWLHNYTTWMNIIFFFFVCVGLFGFSYLYSAKRNPKAYYTYGNKKIQIGIATLIGLLVFLIIDINITRLSNEDLLNVFMKFPEGKEVLKVQVMAQQWMWKFRYPGEDGEFNTEDDVVTLNDLRLPINKKVVFQVTSKDVIHSFFIPNARSKVDAIPGKVNRIWFEFNKEGKWNIVCAEMCGTHHYLMQAFLTTYNDQDFETWYSQAKQYAEVENDPDDDNVFWGWKWIN
jgi:cytochrome c oxidase subunit II